MGVYIKGMEMPFCCLVCPCSGTDNTDDGNEVWVCEASELRQITTENKIEHRPEWCPLVPVPPHGRLIEESKVLDIVSEWCPDDDGSVGKVGDLREMLDEIEALPTIIPATK